MRLDKKQIQAFFFSLKMDHKESETTCNISNAFGPGIANKCTARWLFKNFCKERESLDNEECSCWPSEVDSGQLRAIIQADPLTTT